MKVVIFGVNGTLTTTKSGAIFKQDPEDTKLLPGVAEGVSLFAKAGWHLVGASNQGGCAAINTETGKPFKSIPEAALEMQNTLKLLPSLKCIYFCPDFEGNQVVRVQPNKWEQFDNSDFPHSDIKGGKIYPSFRKPGCGMLFLAINQLELIGVHENFWMVGDRSEDESAALSAGINFMWAEIWRNHFTKEMRQVLLPSNQINFLERR